MLRRTVIIMLLLLSVSQAQAQGEAGDLLGRINNLRASLGLPGYRLNGALSSAAQSQAQWMADNASVSHNRPDGSGPRTRAVNAGYPTTDVSENIYGGTGGSVDSAWIFWVNSGIHYRGLTNERYQEVGIGIAGSDWGRTFVLVFGNPGGPPPFVPQAGGSGASAGPAAPPSYVVGVDPHGFIMHEVQPEDTLGDIALLYGYTWDDLPYMREINSIEGNLLAEGSIFLVPPHDGTYTPTPGEQGDQAADWSVAEATADPDDEITATPVPSATPTLVPTMAAIATAAAMPEVIALAMPPTETPLVVAQAATPAVMTASTITRNTGPSPILMVALVLQVALLSVAGFEFVRRSRRGRR